MWIMLTKGFLSIVDKAEKKDHLLVRARTRDHLVAVFPNAKITESRGTDYRYRAEIERAVVAAVIADEIMHSLDYRNFKGAVEDKPYHDALMGVWHNMGRLQPGGPYSRGDRGPWSDKPGRMAKRGREQRALFDDRYGVRDDDLDYMPRGASPEG